MIINSNYSDLLTIQEQCQTALLKQIKGNSTFSRGTSNSSPVVAVGFKTGILMKKEILFFSSVHLDLENMKDVGNCGPPGELQLVALGSSV